MINWFKKKKRHTTAPTLDYNLTQEEQELLLYADWHHEEVDQYTARNYPKFQIEGMRGFSLRFKYQYVPLFACFFNSDSATGRSATGIKKFNKTEDNVNDVDPTFFFNVIRAFKNEQEELEAKELERKRKLMEECKAEMNKHNAINGMIKELDNL